MKSATPTICDEVVDCIGGNRIPSDPELFIVAERIWSDCNGSRSAFAWGDLSDDASERTMAIRAAEMAMIGSSL